MQPQTLSSVSQAQRSRLRYIDFRLFFLGELHRADLMERFEVAGAAATRDVALYKEFAPQNMVFNDPLKRYEPSETFRPLFGHAPLAAMTLLMGGTGDSKISDGIALLPCSSPPCLEQLNVQVIAPISRAIHLQKVVQLTYTSEAGRLKIELVPHAFIRTGTAHLVRGYDRKANKFSDFELGLIDSSMIIASEIESNETSLADDDWTRIITLHLVVHPDHRHPKTVIKRFGLLEKSKTFKVRASAVGYLLKETNVDCSNEHNLDPDNHQLWLKEAEKVLHGVESAVMAPGFIR